MKKSILFIAALVIVSSDFIAQGSVQEKEKAQTKQVQQPTKSKKQGDTLNSDNSKVKSRKKNDEMRKMDNYKNNEPAGSNNAEQKHMDTTINNHR